MTNAPRVALLLAACSFCGPLVASEPTFTITPNRSRDFVVVESMGNEALFSVHSATGIGEAKIRRNGNQWPTRVVLRFYLRGLENLRLSNGKTTLHAEVASHGEPRHCTIAMVDTDQKETQLEPSSPFWMAIELPRDNVPATEPNALKGAYFQMRLPPGFFRDNPSAITMKWIDFYR
ncbi:hypothetical protein [Rosistilla carotiformis]|nr:hypothetical protein [Rosistilla carotiformis]